MEIQPTQQATPGSNSVDAFLNTAPRPEGPINEMAGFNGEYIPPAPTTLEEAGLHPNDLFPLILKFL